MGRIQTLLGVCALGAALALGGCGRSSDDAELAKLDNQLVGSDTDPALNSALQDQILVDPSLSQQSNRNAVRPPESPVQAQYPSGGPIQGAPSGCGAEFEYAAGWANRLPAPFAIYPGSRLTEAAANNQGDCRMRVVTFTSSAAADQLLGWYQARVEAAGYSAERQRRGEDLVLAGTEAQGEGAYFLIVTPRSGGAEVALITNQGV